MKAIQKLLKALDQALGFPNKVESRITKIRQGFDPLRVEHVFLVEYRCRVDQGPTPRQIDPNQEFINDLRTRTGMVEWNPRVRS